MPKRSEREEPRLPPGRFRPFGEALQAHAGPLVAAAMSHYIERGRGVLLLSATTLEPRGFLSLKAARRFRGFSALAREAGGYSPKGQALVLAVDARHAVLFLLQLQRGRAAFVDLLGGGLLTECLRASHRTDSWLDHARSAPGGSARGADGGPFIPPGPGSFALPKSQKAKTSNDFSQPSWKPSATGSSPMTDTRATSE